MTANIDWDRCWIDVATVLREHSAAGRQHLLTEDVVRFALARILEGQSVAPERITFEHRVTGVGPIDLVIDSMERPMGAAIEIKFPRDPKEKNSADTMTVGELLNDFYRLARLDSAAAWALQIIGTRLAQHLARRTDRPWILTAGEAFTLTAGSMAALPLTARRAAAAALDDLALVADCTAVHAAGDLTVIAYRVSVAPT